MSILWPLVGLQRTSQGCHTITSTQEKVRRGSKENFQWQLIGLTPIHSEDRFMLGRKTVIWESLTILMESCCRKSFHCFRFFFNLFPLYNRQCKHTTHTIIGESGGFCKLLPKQSSLVPPYCIRGRHKIWNLKLKNIALWSR